MVLVLGMMISSCIPKGFQGWVWKPWDSLTKPTEVEGVCFGTHFGCYSDAQYSVTKPTEVEGFCWNPKRHSDAHQ